ncbi:hypothetical protein GCM10027575_49350 [Phytohabitans suffuscus]
MSHAYSEDLLLPGGSRPAESASQCLVYFMIKNSEGERHGVLLRKLAHHIDDLIPRSVIATLAGLPIPVHIQGK